MNVCGADRRVTSLEQTDIRGLDPVLIGGPVELAVADLSFISLRLVLPSLGRLVEPGHPIVTLVKPQFEAGRAEASRFGGVIRDPAIWRLVLAEVVASADDLGMGLRAATVSGITGAKGNVEFVVWLAAGGPSLDEVDPPAGRGRPSRLRTDALLDQVVAEAEARGR